MATPSDNSPSPLLETRQKFLLWLAGASSVLPAGGHLPSAIIAFTCLLLIWRGLQIWRGGWHPPRLFLLLALALAGWLLSQVTPGRLGIEHLAMLVPVTACLKQLECRTRRDAFVSVLLIFFQLLASFMFSQTIMSAALAGVSLLLAMSALASLHSPQGPVLQPIGVCAVLLAQALPFMVTLFVLFPRNLMPLWTLPPSASRAETGLKEWMSPGSISDLTLSAETAFRVQFMGAAPPTQQLYWRGPVMTDFDGRTWRAGELWPAPLPYLDRGKPVLEYELTLEPHNSRWLLALDTPVSLPSGAFFTRHHQLVANGPVRTRQRYTGHAVLAANTDSGLQKVHLASYLQLPRSGNSRARQLAAKMRQDHEKDEALVRAAINFISTNGFTYTLSPPQLGINPIDDFLFETKRGFCEHFASSFVFLMRAAGIPARVVTGYQGGEINPIDGYLVVRQADAHAWAEVWIAGQGWQRVDPTAAAAPIRVVAGMATALPLGEPLPFTLRSDIPWLRDLRFRLDAITNGWNQWVLGYSTQSQQKILAQLGLNKPDWRTLAVASTLLVAIFMALLALWAAWPQTRRDALQSSWQRLSKKLGRHGLARQTWEGPGHYAMRISTARPELRDEIHTIAQLYAQLRYGADNAPTRQQIRQLRTLIRRFSP